MTIRICSSRQMLMFACSALCNAVYCAHTKFKSPESLAFASELLAHTAHFIYIRALCAIVCNCIGVCVRLYVCGYLSADMFAFSVCSFRTHSIKLRLNWSSVSNLLWCESRANIQTMLTIDSGEKFKNLLFHWEMWSDPIKTDHKLCGSFIFVRTNFLEHDRKKYIYCVIE